MTDPEEEEKERFLDFGPCDIADWNDFLPKAKERFNEQWNKLFTPKEVKVTLLGSGSFGNVMLIKHNENGKFYAMKEIEEDKIIKYKQMEHTKNEKMFLQSIDFPFTSVPHVLFQGQEFIYKVMPFIPGQELFGHLRKFGKFNEVQAKFYISQVILALEYLHYLELVYRDLKPENILIDHTGYLKVTDFEFCKRLTRNRTYTLCGTPEYLAPEVIMSKGYSKAVDWWGVGVLTYELVAGNSPFYASEPMKIYEKIVTLKYKMPPSFSPDLKDLVKNILQVDLTRRYGNLKNGVDDIKGHKWFKAIDWMAVLNRKFVTPSEVPPSPPTLPSSSSGSSSSSSGSSSPSSFS